MVYYWIAIGILIALLLIVIGIYVWIFASLFKVRKSGQIRTDEEIRKFCEALDRDADHE
jgi:hypothetical protein